ncbi:MAG: 16S rRNA (guanine(966)-N(2))-methyltransferase RsmD [Alphaproteobacteria bacterium]|nr:16S rRNA (guanine(966)-N(2))-methyltransferase RsmD [Alphaproteobacteria bacterium]
MRVVGGQYKNRKLVAPKGDNTRPTLDKTREALFDILNAHLKKKGQKWQDIVFLDVFAGTGAVGIEALSRGAKKAFFVENNAEALDCIRQNTQGMDNAVICALDAALPPFTSVPADIVFLDAPYYLQLWEKALIALKNNGWLTTQTTIVVEVASKEDVVFPTDFEADSERVYGKNKLLFCRLKELKKLNNKGE